MPNNKSNKNLLARISNKLNERNCLFILFALFLFFSVLIVLIPYDPMMDHADATTNDIWVGYYSQGIHHIPYDEWNHTPTQSVVVEYQNEYVVVNEKGPGHVVMLLPFYMSGLVFLFAPLMIAFAVFSTYMLGKRLANWRVGFIAALLVLTNVTVLVMWYRSYWTDASTMHMLVLSIWLLIETNYWYNGRTMDPRKVQNSTTKQKLFAIGLGILSGLALGASISTRYATALILIAILLYVLIFYLVRAWPDLKKHKIKNALKSSSGMWITLGAFILGLIIVLIPLMQYNSTYFGSPFQSGYDAVLVNQFNSTEGITPRETSGEWSSDLDSMVLNALSNFIALLPLLIMRMPTLIFLPLGIWIFRRRPALLVLLLGWIVINFFTYLSISWVDMYTRLPPDVLHEPRYFMPAVPALALLAGIAIDRLTLFIARKMSARPAPTPEEVRPGRAVVTISIVGILVLSGAVPALFYFANLEEGGALFPGIPQHPQLITVTTDELVNSPLKYKDKPVKLENTLVIDTGYNEITVRSMGAVEPEGVKVRFRDWPPGTIPQVGIGSRVELVGRFIVITQPYVPQESFIIVKYDTKDYLKVLG